MITEGAGRSWGEMIFQTRGAPDQDSRACLDGRCIEKQ
jgi:hypothetical protein